MHYTQIPVGLEKEGFAYDSDGEPIDVLGHKHLLEKTHPEGSFTSDAGLNQLELINPSPHPGCEGALAELASLTARLPKEWEVAWTARLPGYQSGQIVNWADKPRYRVMHEALARESPNTWAGVKQIATWSALQLNVSISPWSPGGLLVMNLLNNVGPYVGAQVREEFPDSVGHLNAWNGWALDKRLPCHGEWWTGAKHFSRHFRQQRRLIDGFDKHGGFWWVDLKSPQSIFNLGDLGSFWKLVRPKKSRFGWYLEIRLLPSMSEEATSRHVDELLRGIHTIMRWSEENGPSLEYHSENDAMRVLPEVAKASRLFPNHPLTKDEWQKNFVA